MNHKNEFLREKPKKKEGFAFSIIHKVIPLLICFLVTWFASQKCAYLLDYNSRLCGAPWYVTSSNHPVYYPFLIVLLIIKHMGTQNAAIGNIISYCAFIMTGGIFGAVILYFILSWARNVFNKEESIYGTARWGTAKDLKENGLLENNGVVLGQLNTADVRYMIKDGAVKLSISAKFNVHNAILYCKYFSTKFVLSQEERQKILSNMDRKTAPLVQHSGKTSTIFFAPSRSGKGVSSVITTLLNYPHSIITIDPKGENFNITAGYRSKFSYIWRFSPVNKNTLRFNILDEIEEVNAYRDASIIAQILTAPADGAQKGDPHWVETAKDLLIGTILHVKCSDYPEKNMYGVLSLLSKIDDDDKGGTGFLHSMIKSRHCSDALHEIIVNVAGRCLKKPDDERGSVISSAVTALQIFEDPLVRNATKASDFCLNDFRFSEVPISWYLTIPFSDLDRLAPLMRLLISFILRKFSQEETQFGEIKLKHPILFLIDEFPTLGAFQVLETMMGILAGYGITFFLICQSMTQIIKLYGENNPILDHCRVMATYAMSDVKSAEMFSKLIGVESVTNSNISSSGSRYDFGMNNMSVSNQTVQRNLMNPDEIQHLPANQMIVFSQGMPATICKKNAYYADGRFNKKVNLPKPETREELLQETVNSCKEKPYDKHWYDIPADFYLPTYDIEVIPGGFKPPVEKSIRSNESDENLTREQLGALI